MSHSWQYIHVTRLGDIHLAVLGKHRFDENVVRMIADELDRLVAEEDCKKLILSLSETETLLSVMIARLIHLRRRLLDRGGKLKLCDLSPEATQVLESCQLLNFFDIAPNVAAAKKAFGR
ncbi:MAG: hypothetical protein KatS3mg105_2512 [Gemmatales bacterium]|nr:MAG: hypothetical protein KatS3mg105_2512 [Gemmatales bacterium]